MALNNPSTPNVGDKGSWPREYSKEVWIKRSPALLGLPGQPQEDVNPKIGSAFRNRDVLRGLTTDEEKRFFPDIIGIQPLDINWNKEAKNYWININVPVPVSGLKLQVGIMYNNYEDYIFDQEQAPWNGVSKIRYNLKGTPININDYIIWRYCLEYGRVANKVEDINISPNIGFYLYSRDEEIVVNKRSLEDRKKANRYFYDNMGDRDWVDHTLRVMIANDKSSSITAVHVYSLSEDEKDIMLEEYVKKRPSEFYRIGTDKDLRTRSFIERAIAEGHLKRIPNTDTVVYDTTPIGSSTDQAVAFFKDSRNVDLVNTIRARMKLSPNVVKAEDTEVKPQNSNVEEVKTNTPIKSSK